MFMFHTTILRSRTCSFCRKKKKARVLVPLPPTIRSFPTSTEKNRPYFYFEKNFETYLWKILRTLEEKYKKRKIQVNNKKYLNKFWIKFFDIRGKITEKKTVCKFKKSSGRICVHFGRNCQDYWQNFKEI